MAGNRDKMIFALLQLFKLCDVLQHTHHEGSNLTVFCYSRRFHQQPARFLGLFIDKASSYLEGSFSLDGSSARQLRNGERLPLLVDEVKALQVHEQRSF